MKTTQDDFDALNAYLTGTGLQDSQMSGTANASGKLSDAKDEQQMQIARLMNDLKNIRQTQQSYGVPTIGDIFRAKPEDIQDTINSVYFMMKQRVGDIDFRQDVRQKMLKTETSLRETQDQLAREKQRTETLQKQLKDTENRYKNQLKTAKDEKDRVQGDRDELNKQIVKLQNKETQYKHELRQKEVQITKLQDTMKSRIFADKKAGPAIASSVELQGAVRGNAEFKFSKISGDHDFHLMISREQEQVYTRMRDENLDLRECLRLLQKEIMDIVSFKQDMFTKRFKAEYGSAREPAQETQEALAHKVELIRDELFNVNFEENGRELVQKFRLNFQRLKEFMQTVDKEISSLAIFNQRDDPLSSNDYVSGALNYADENDPNAANNTSVQQLKHMLRNYDGLVEGQHHLLNQSITKMAKIPPPDEITATFNRFQVLKDSELDEFRGFLDEHKDILTQQYRDFDQERHAFDEMNKRMESDKVKISEEREKIEQEVRRIRDLNLSLQRELCTAGGADQNQQL